MRKQYLSFCACICLSISHIWRCREGGDKIVDVLLRAKIGGRIIFCIFICVRVYVCVNE